MKLSKNIILNVKVVDILLPIVCHWRFANRPRCLLLVVTLFTFILLRVQQRWVVLGGSSLSSKCLPFLCLPGTACVPSELTHFARWTPSK